MVTDAEENANRTKLALSWSEQKYGRCYDSLGEGLDGRAW